MTPAIIKGFTHTPGAPLGWNPLTQGPCGALPVIFQKDKHDNDECVSAWKPTPEELAQLNNGGFVILSVCGWQPPVSIYVGDKDVAS